MMHTPALRVEVGVIVMSKGRITRATGRHQSTQKVLFGLTTQVLPQMQTATTSWVYLLHIMLNLFQLLSVVPSTAVLQVRTAQITVFTLILVAQTHQG